jgi:hypothetical protein
MFIPKSLPVYLSCKHNRLKRVYIAEFLSVHIKTMLSEISRSHGGEYEDDSLMGYCAV